MFDPHDSRQMKLFHDSYKVANRELEQFRKRRLDLIREFIGTSYSDGATGPDSKNPVNMIALMNDIYLMHLAGANPQVLFTVGQEQLMPFAADLQAVVNQELKDMSIADTIRKWIQEALFGGLGVIKCGLVDSDYIEIIPGQPQASQEYFADIVDMSDLCFDIEAKNLKSVTWMSDRYLADYEMVMESDAYDKMAKMHVQRNDRNPDQIVSEYQHARSISFQERTSTEENFKPGTFLIDIWLPEEGLLVTIPDNEHTAPPLRVVEWEGPSSGPYHMLSFIDVPGNPMPMSQIGILASLNRLVNATWRKIDQQARRQKKVGLYRKGAQDDAKEIQKAQDGDLVGIEHPDGFLEANLGGVAQENLAVAIQADQVFTRLAGNLDALGGLGPSSETIGQDQMISNQSSQKAAKMTTAVVDATSKLIKDLVYYIWNDPIRIYTTERQVEGTDITLEIKLEPENRSGSIEEFNMTIEPYSMSYRSPRERMGELMQIFSTIIMPAMPMLQMTGIGINMQRFLEYIAKYSNLPELNHILEYTGAPMPGGDGEARSSPTSHRVQERINRPGATRQGNDQAMVAGLTGQNRQSSQQAVRQVG